LLPTPTSADDNRMPDHRHKGGNHTLQSAAYSLLPTPSANDSTGGEGATRKARQEQGTGGPSLRDVAHLLPTPSAEHNDGQNPELFLALGMAVQLLPTPTGQDAANTAGPSQHERNSDPLNVTVTKLLPTPHVESHESATARDWRGDLTGALSGASTSSPSDAGNTPSDALHHVQLTIEAG
jgi:hypothetical protein